MEKKKTLIQSLGRALDILELIRDNNVSMRASDVATQLGLGVATAHNIIRSLFQRGYLVQDENSRYLLGPECFRLYKRASNDFEELRQLVEAPVAELAEATGDTTFFGCEYFGSLYCVAMSIGGGELVVNNAQKWLDQLHCTAAGKIIIAHHGIEWFAKLCRKKTLQSFSPHTITTVEMMAQEINQIRRDGYALSVNECYEGISALGIAVHDAKGKFVGSLAQCFPSFFLDSGAVVPGDRAALLKEYAGKITSGLGL